MKNVMMNSLILSLGLFSASAWAQEDCVTISSSTVIDAPYWFVFGTIIDFESYPEWNPYIVNTIPSDPDVTTVGEQFVLEVVGPVTGTVTFAPEIVTQVDLNFRRALLAYAFDDPFAAALGFPERVQEVRRVPFLRSHYETSETFCGPLVPFLPLDDVQAGFDAQTEALAEEAEARWDALFCD